MPDTGEPREIKQRINAKEAEIVSQSKILLQRSKRTKRSPERRDSKKKATRKSRS